MNVLVNSTPQNVRGRPAKGRKQKKPKAKPPKAKPKQAPPAKQAAKPAVHLSGCIVDYASVLNEPTRAYHEGRVACVPDDVVFPTLKRSFLVRGPVVVGATGLGYVLFAPYAPGHNNVIASTAATGIIPSDNFDQDQDSVTNEFPLSQVGGDSSFTAGKAEYRIVGAELCLDYSGPLLDRGGTITSYHAPHNDDLSVSSADKVMAEATAFIQQVSGRTTSTKWLPASAGDLGFTNGSDSFWTNAIIVSGAPGSTFMYTAVAHYELIGQNFRSTGGVTMSESDTPGLSAVLNAANETASKSVPTNEFLNRVGEAFMRTTSYVTQGIVAGAMAGATLAVQRRTAIRY